MARNIIRHLRRRRENRKHYVNIDGIYIPQDRKMWTDDLEREMLRARSGFRF